MRKILCGNRSQVLSPNPLPRRLLLLRSDLPSSRTSRRWRSASQASASAPPTCFEQASHVTVLLFSVDNHWRSQTSSYYGGNQSNRPLTGNMLENQEDSVALHSHHVQSLQKQNNLQCSSVRHLGMKKTSTDAYVPFVNCCPPSVLSCDYDAQLHVPSYLLVFPTAFLLFTELALQPYCSCVPPPPAFCDQLLDRGRIICVPFFALLLCFGLDRVE